MIQDNSCLHWIVPSVRWKTVLKLGQISPTSQLISSGHTVLGDQRQLLQRNLRLSVHFCSGKGQLLCGTTNWIWPDVRHVLCMRACVRMCVRERVCLCVCKNSFLFEWTVIPLLDAKFGMSAKVLLCGCGELLPRLDASFFQDFSVGQHVVADKHVRFWKFWGLVLCGAVVVVWVWRLCDSCSLHFWTLCCLCSAVLRFSFGSKLHSVVFYTVHVVYATLYRKTAYA